MLAKVKTVTKNEYYNDEEKMMYNFIINFKFWSSNNILQFKRQFILFWIIIKINVSGKHKLENLKSHLEPLIWKKWILLHNIRKYWLWKVYFLGNIKAKDPWSQVDRIACHRMAKPEWYQHQYARQILQGAY